MKNWMFFVFVVLLLISAATVSAQSLTADEAETLALENRGASRDSVRNLRSRLDRDDDGDYYEISFSFDHYRCEYEIHPVSGAILEFNADPDRATLAALRDAQKSQQKLGESSAKSIVTFHADVNEEQTRFISFKEDMDDGLWLYEIEFVTDGIKYDYELNAVTGEIYSFSVDYPRDRQHIYHAPVTPVNGISEEEAQSIAMQYARVDPAQVTYIRSERDIERGVPVYEFDFTAAGMEYEVTVSAQDGSILSYESELRD